MPKSPAIKPKVQPEARVRARVLRDWNGHVCGEWADFDTATLQIGVASGALDPHADEAAYLASLRPN